MAAVSANEVKVGIMVALTILLLVALTISVGELNNLFTENVTIHVQVSSVIGLEPYAQVTYSGVQIGIVNKIRYSEEKNMPVVDITIDSNSPVSTDSKARFTSSGLLSPLFIEISGGSEEKRIKKLLNKRDFNPDNVYLEAEPYVDVLSLSSNVKQALTKVEGVLDSLHPTLNQIGGLVSNVSKEVGIILKEVDKLAVSSRPKFLAILDNTNDLIEDASSQVVPALKDIRSSAGEVPNLISNAGDKVTHVIDKTGGLIDSVSPEVIHTVKEIRSTVQELQNRIHNIENHLTLLLSDVDNLVVDNRQDIDRIIDQLKLTTANLEDISRQLSKNPWRLIWKTEERVQPDKVSPEWNPLEN